MAPLPDLRVLRILALLLAAFEAFPLALPAQGVGAPPRGYLVGRVIERESGRPLEGVNVVTIDGTARTVTDLDGRFRLAVPAGLHAVRVFRLGSTPAQVDSLLVEPGRSTTANFALAAAPVTLQAVAVTAGPLRASSEDALLAQQKSAARVSDGISAEAIRRAPGADAGDAIVRVTGVSVVDNKFAVVRGLAERYSNTLLNGVELPSPEPLKKIVPLDLFPTSLLESIVVSKTATPDRPADFAGGSVEVTTKEFPDDRVAEFSMSFGYNAQSTLRRVAHLGSRGVDWFGFDDGRRRQMPSGPLPAPGPASPVTERFAERLRNAWTPEPRTVEPDLGAALNLGGRLGGDAAPFGYALSLTYSRQVDATPNRLAQLVFDKETGIPDQGYTSQEATTTVDIGAIANFAMRLGSTQKIGWKNLFTRNAEEMLARTSGYETYNGNAERLIHQARFISRSLAQTQLSGEHLIAPLLESRLEWRATYAVSSRDEPENRSLIYFRTPTQEAFTLSPSNPSPIWFRFLDDAVRSVQLDWSVPLERVLPPGAQFKAGTLYRERNRAFDAYFFRLWANAAPEYAPVLTLPPEEVFSGEVLGSALGLRREGESALPYESDDDVRAFYGMVDLPVTPWFRLVGGLRHEDWKLNLYQGTREVTLGVPTRRRTSDDLLSANLTFSLSDRQNLRVAAYQTVARPDPRELAPDYYIAVTGDCANRGNPLLRSSRIMNGDLRWEFYPRAGELISVSAFHKDFADPIGELLTFPGSSNCTTEYFNLETAQVTGTELELRRALEFLPGVLGRLAIGINLTLVDSRSVYRADSTVTRTFRLQGQSDRLANLNVIYSDPEGGRELSLLLNNFSDRIVRYGIANVTPDGVVAVPNVMEQGRTTLDAKYRVRIGVTSVSLSVQNLLDAEVIYYQDSDVGRTRTGYRRPGTSLSLGLGYAIR